MTGFLKWTARYGRNKFYKMLLFFILFVVLSFFVSSCKVHASTTYLNGDMYIYAQSQNCVIDANNDIICSKGVSYKMTGVINATNNVSIPYLINNSNNDVLIQNAIYDLHLSETLTIDSTNRSPFLLFGFNGSGNGYANGFNMSGSGGSYNLNMIYNQFNATPLDQSGDAGKNIPITLGFKPYYCFYHNPDNDTVNTCNLILDMATNTSGGFKLILDLPTGTKLDRFAVYFGSHNLYSGGSKTVNTNVRVPNSPTIISSPYTRSYDAWRTNNDTSIGVQYFKQGVSFDTPVLTPPNKSYFVGVDSTSYTGNSYKFNYDNLTNELIAQYQATIPEIEEELTPPPEDDDIGEYVDGFVDSSESNSFLNLFNALIQYPISRFNQQSSYGLTYTNIYGDEILSDVVCRGLVYPGDFGEKLKFTWNGKHFYFPCVHYDVYAEMYSDNFAFYPTYVNNAPILHGNNKNLYSIIKIVLDGFLIYVLFINCLHIYKYIFDSDDKQIEVLDL